MRKPDKYPPLDPRLPHLYDRILSAAQAMRSARHAENVANWAVRKAQRIASLPVSKNNADELDSPLMNPEQPMETA
jgi:hypothetical protein